MKLGILKDIKSGEYRVVATPDEVKQIIADGHEVYVSRKAGYLAGFEDEDYEEAGAVMTDNEHIWESCDLIAKVKEIEESEFKYLKEGQIIYTCIHPAAHKEEVDHLLESKVIAFTAEDSHRYGSPNCVAAGKAGAFLGLWAMMSFNGGNGKFADGINGSDPVNAIVCGAGMVGKNAIDVLYRLGCNVYVLDAWQPALDAIEEKYHGEVKTAINSRQILEELLPNTDLICNAVRWPKDASEPMITREMVASMRRGSVICDISNDYGCIETFHETTHDEPTYIEEGVVHYCVSNIPGAIAGSTSVAYARGVLPHLRNIMNNGVAEACVNDGFLRRCMVAYKGYLTHEETSGIQKRPWVRPEVILGIEDRDLDPAPAPTKTKSEICYPEFSK